MQSISIPAQESARPTARTFSVRSLAREPLLHFFALGALIFAAAHSIEAAREEAQRQIVIDDALRSRIAQLQAVQTGVSPSPQQLESLVQSHIDDEVLYREALRLGLEQDDEIIRRRLIQKLEFLQRDASQVALPSDEQLRAYFEANVQRFAQPALASFTQVYFSADKEGERAAHARAQRARALLETKAEPAGDVSAVPNAWRDQTSDEVVRTFGDSPLAEAVFSSPVGAWSQPVRSGYGWHLVKVEARSTPAPPPFEDIAADVRAAFLQDASVAAKRRALDELRARYDVIDAAAASQPGAP